MDALEAASEANSAKKRALQELLDSMLEHSVPRVAVVDPKTNRRKWLEITEGEPKLRSVKAEAGELVESPADRRRRSGGRTEHEEPAATRDALADLPENRIGLPVARADADRATAGRPNAPRANGELVDDAGASPDLRTAGQQRRRVRR